MLLKKINIAGNLKLQLFILSLVILFLYRLIIDPAGNYIFLLINDLLVISVFLFLSLNISGLVKTKRENPLSLVMLVGIISAGLFLLSMFSSAFFSFFGLEEDILRSTGIFQNSGVFLYGLLIMGLMSFIFLSFRELYYLKQRQDVTVYYNTMIIFFILTSVSVLLPDELNLSFISNSFFVISILLIFINSLRISWIAFIVKREKITLIILSVVITVIFIINAVNISGDGFHSQLISEFSSTLSEFSMIIMIYGAVYFSVLFFTTLFHIPTAEAFDRKAREVSSFQYFSKLITQVLDFKELAETVTDITKKVSNADASWIILKGEKDYQLHALTGIGIIEADKLTKYLISLEGADSLRETIIIRLHDLYSADPGNENYSNAALSPLQTHNNSIGFIVALKKSHNIFNEEDKSAINTFSDYASVAIENARLLEESIEKERLERELDVAREIQRKILPSDVPVLKNLSISAMFIPAFEVGGDYYDFFEIEKDKLGFMIADVSGKGISAAFVMAELKGIFTSLSQTVGQPREILIKANDILKRALDKKTFVSAAYGIIDIRHATATIARAGHCPILLIRNNSAEHIRPVGMGLGLSNSSYFDSTLEEINLNLYENDLLVLYTDGITEAKNKDLEDFGERKFEDILINNSEKNVNEITNAVIREVTLFSKDHSQYDDITLVIIKWKHNNNHLGEEEWQNSTPQLKTRTM